jgi:inorganic pyrophosphatase
MLNNIVQTSIIFYLCILFMSDKITVYIEIEKDSNIKYEFDKKLKELIVDRILPEPYRYPYAYGFIPNTLAMDGDDLDILVITDKHLLNDCFYHVFIIGVLIMEDEKGMDEKILCVLEDDYTKIQNITDLDESILDKIHWFFSNYKNNSDGKWSKVLGYDNREHAIKLYNKSIIKTI